MCRHLPLIISLHLPHTHFPASPLQVCKQEMVQCRKSAEVTLDHKNTQSRVILRKQNSFQGNLTKYR